MASGDDGDRIVKFSEVGNQQFDQRAGLPTQLAGMALFAVNTGCRDGEISSLQWDWKIDVPQLARQSSLFPVIT